MINFEDEDFDLAEGFLDDVLPPSRGTQRPADALVGGGGGLREPRTRLPPAPAARPDGPDDPGAFTCTPDSVSVSQIFGLRAAAAGGGGGQRALPGPAHQPAAGDPSQVDPFADDDLLDADLLDACEAADSAPLVANLPTTNGATPGLRDMLTNACGPGLGSRDTPTGAAFPGPWSRDTPTSAGGAGHGSRDSRRRSTGSAVKRRFPGPAGILPITGSLLTLAHEVSLQEDDLTTAAEDDDHALHDAASQSALSQPEDTADWEVGPWRQMLAELRLSSEDPDCMLRRINISAIRRAAANNKLRKVPLMAVALMSLEPTSDLSYQAKFRDPTGQMDGTVAKDAFEHCGGALRPGCVLVLRDVVVWRESARRLYLSVTRRSLVYLFSETLNSANAVSLLKLSEVSVSELLSARLVEESPSVAVLQESPPPSPPRRPQLYATPQVPGGGRGGGRSWRGRGTGSGGRPASYTPRRGGVNPPALRGTSAGFRAARGAATVSPAHGGATAASPHLRGATTSSPALRAATVATRGVATPYSMVNGQSASSPLVSGPTSGLCAAWSASPTLRPYSHPTSGAPAVASSTPDPPAPAAARHKSDTISAADIDAMFDDDDDVLFGQL